MPRSGRFASAGEFVRATGTPPDLAHGTLWAADALQGLAGLDGVDLARTIRRRHGDRPVVLTSGYSRVLARDGTHGLDLLNNPYSVEQRSRILRRVTTRRRKGRCGATSPGNAGRPT